MADGLFTLTPRVIYIAKGMVRLANHKLVTLGYVEINCMGCNFFCSIKLFVLP